MIEWKNIPNYEQQYQVSNTGIVKSLKRTRKGVNNSVISVPEKILQPRICQKTKRQFVVLSSENNKKTIGVSQLVAIAFFNHKRCGTKIVVDHIDNDPSNNHIDNLQLISTRENLTKDKFNKTGYTGVCLFKGKYQSYIFVNGKKKHLGIFDDSLGAYKRYLQELKNT